MVRLSSVPFQVTSSYDRRSMSRAQVKEEERHWHPPAQLRQEEVSSSLESRTCNESSR